VHLHPGSDDVAAERRADALVTETHAQNR
jgi:hypothetical protein